MIKVSIDGTSIAGSEGLLIQASGSIVRGLSIGGFTNAIHLDGAADVQIVGNFLGLTPSGVDASPIGFAAVLADSSPGLILGGSTPADRNIIAFSGAGLYAQSGSDGAVIRGNYIGTDRTGTQAASNSTGLLFLGVSGAQVGGTASGAGNVISGNSDLAIQFNGSSDNVVQGNLIGTDVTGEVALGNRGGGVLMISGASNNLIGGAEAGARNVISANSGGLGLGFDAIGNVIRGNYFYCIATISVRSSTAA